MIQPAECPRVPAAEVRPANVAASLTTSHLRDASRLIAVAYPGLSLYYDQRRNKVYVVDAGEAYEVIVKFERDDESGYAALALLYLSRHDAALRGGERMAAQSCRSRVEVVVARMGTSGTPSITSRQLIDDEALAVEVRTLDMARDLDGALGVRLFYHAYYADDGWFGYITFRSEVEVQGTRLVTHRLPAGYVKTSGGAQRREQQGMLGPAGQRPGFVRLTAASFDKGTYEEIEVPVIGGGSMSGLEILRRIP